MENTPTNKMAGNIGNTFPSRIPENIKTSTQAPKSAAQSHIPTRNAYNPTVQTTELKEKLPEKIVSTQSIPQQAILQSSTPNATTQQTQPTIQSQQAEPNQVQQTVASTVTEPPVITNEQSEQEIPKQNKIAESYDQLMSPKPLEGNSLKILIALGIMSVIIYIATLVL